VQSVPATGTQTVVLVALLYTPPTIQTPVNTTSTPVHETLAPGPGKPRLTGTPEAGTRLRRSAASVIQARVRLTRIEPVLTVGTGVTGRACAVVAVYVIDTRASI